MNTPRFHSLKDLTLWLDVMGGELIHYDRQYPPETVFRRPTRFPAAFVGDTGYRLYLSKEDFDSDRSFDRVKLNQKGK